MKVICVIASLETGGAQRVFVELVNWFQRNGIDIIVALSNKKGELLSLLDKDIPVIDLGRSSRWSFLKIAIKLSNQCKQIKPDIILGFMNHGNVLSVIANNLLWPNKRKVILTEHLSQIGTKINSKWIHRFLADLFYKRASKVIAVSKGVANDVVYEYKFPKNKVETIYNPVLINEIQRKAVELKVEKSGEYIIYVGRLDEAQKSLTTLIDAFEIVSKFWNGELIILGDGEDKKMISSYIEQKQLQNKIKMLGNQVNPYPYIKFSKCLILPSNYEGFGCVLVEAMALGTPVVATKCPHGPEEIISDSKDGFLVPVKDSKKMADKILEIVTNKDLRKSLSENCLKSVGRFSVDHSGKEYKRIFKEVLNV